MLLRLPLEVAPIFKDWLLRHYPDRYRHVMSLVRSMRDGKDYDSEWGKRMKGSGPYAWQIGRRFEIAARKLGLNMREAAAAQRSVRGAGTGRQAADAALTERRSPAGHDAGRAPSLPNTVRPRSPAHSRRCLPGPLPLGREACGESELVRASPHMARPRSDSPPLFEMEEIRPDFSIERRAMKRGVWPVAGLDEAGRGPLAGPVVAAAVILDPKRIPEGSTIPSGLPHDEREELFEVILKKALAVSFASCSAETHRPHQHPARPASRRCAARLCGLALKPQLALADGLRRAARPALRRAGAGQGRPALAVDRRRLDRRQGHARPHDGDVRHASMSTTASSCIWAMRRSATARRSKWHGACAGCTASPSRRSG